MTIGEFIAARLDEDEETARAAFGGPGDNGVWERDHDPYAAEVVFSDWIHIYAEGGHSATQAEHIARHDPARELRQAAAVRAVVELHHGESWCDICPDPEDRHTHSPMPCEHLRHLAAIWTDHPDYRAEWALP
ncbi:DUF6221 family protein [Nocardia sp. NPDC058633]|uniref:DUF6221 family protein n=1 Tax=Nocardia sp. NPDC058633 TaxID=3346568 RepID=UPI0036574C9D